ncbi:hypothetical protein R1sor_015457 [Riccia sorocarpa]|uniref:VPS37 C-terminal domain-containing protein n=1 Tax=Riccia sorocarpa TaxID=122646 RepID=A0ABD3HC99_9MARC
MDGVAMRGGPQQQAESATPFIPTHSWYPPSVLGPSTSGARVSSPSTSSTGTANPLSRTSTSSSDSQRPRSPASQPQRTSQVSSTVPVLKDKSAEELRGLLLDKDLYNAFLHSLDQVRQLDTVRDDLKKGNIDLARHNLGKEAEIAELRNQCMIIRNTQLAAAREKFEEVDKREKEVNARCSPAALLDRLQDAANEADEESEKIHQQLLSGEIELAEFISKYRKERILYHKRSLTRMAAMTSLTTPG